jgi:hypothetical protein
LRGKEIDQRAGFLVRPAMQDEGRKRAGEHRDQKSV